MKNLLGKKYHSSWFLFQGNSLKRMINIRVPGFSISAFEKSYLRQVSTFFKKHVMSFLSKDGEHRK